jgi:MFS family permease
MFLFCVGSFIIGLTSVAFGFLAFTNELTIFLGFSYLFRFATFIFDFRSDSYVIQQLAISKRIQKHTKTNPKPKITFFVKIYFYFRFIGGVAEAAAWGSILSILVSIFPGKESLVFGGTEMVSGFGAVIGL